MSNFLTTVGQMAQGFVPTMLKLDAAKRDERSLASQEATEEGKRLSLKQSTILNAYETDEKRKRQEDDNSFRSHLQSWKEGRQRIEQGDFSGFERELADYNSQAGAYADGHTIKGRASEDGKATILDRFDKDGKLVDSSQPLTRGEITRLYDLGMGKKLQFMSPERYDQTVKAAAAFAEKQKDRDSLERRAQIVADARMYETDGRADATEFAADRRASATTEAARIRATAPRNGDLTTAQIRTNDSIAAARQQLAGMSQDDVHRKTQNSIASGRVNPEYDGNLARVAKLANSRMFGEDPEHDKFSTGKAKDNAAASARAEIASRFRADKTMGNRTLGRETPNGVEVMEKGKLIGYFR